MKIESSMVTKLLITDVDALDAVTVILEDLGPNKGKINIDCYGEAWSAYWGGMGIRSISEFFCSCDEDYLAKNLSSVTSIVTDYEKIGSVARAKINEKIRTLLDDRRELFIGDSEAREKFADLKGRLDSIPCISCDAELHYESDFMSEVFGDEWWHDVPTKLSDDYLYLCRIIKAVKEALRSLAVKKAA